jgi:tetratricopeptide (TPR) repeat protein
MDLGTPMRAWQWLRSRLHRRLADAHRHFGNLYGNQEEHWAAIEHYTRATVLDPDYTQSYYSRGVLYWREIGNPHRAIQDLSRVLELDPSWSEAYFNRGLAHRMRREIDKAMADFESYLAQGTDDFWLDSARRQLAELRSEGETPLASGTPAIEGR